MGKMEEPDGRFAHGLFRRTSWLCQGRPPAIAGLRGLRRDRACSLHCDASRARPSSEQI
ncbi:hypothetical protein J4G37_09945 [Microvirga sp. 3-52]|nr:hypothetical protein [Microvirga sp. 3-52]